MQKDKSSDSEKGRLGTNIMVDKHLTPQRSRWLRWFLMLSYVAFGSVSAWGQLPVGKQEGQIQKLNFETYQVRISVYDYSVALDAKVEIDGSFGAFTLLKRGMLVAFRFQQTPNGERLIIEIEEVDSVQLF